MLRLPADLKLSPLRLFVRTLARDPGHWGVRTGLKRLLLRCHNGADGLARRGAPYCVDVLLAQLLLDGVWHFVHL